MRETRTMVRSGLAAIFAASLALPAWAETLVVAPGEGSLQDILDRAADGDIVRFRTGEHRGPIRITRKVTVEGEPGAILVGLGKGSVVIVSAPGAVVRGLTVRGSGTDLEKMDAGIFVEKTASGALIEGNRAEGNLYGIYLHGAENSIARGNTIIGIQD